MNRTRLQVHPFSGIGGWLSSLLVTFCYLPACTGGDEPNQIPESSPTPTPAGEVDPLDVRALGPTDHLPGQMLLLEQRANPAFGLTLFDLADQGQRQVFQVPSGAFLYDVDVVPGGSLMALSYSAPAEGEGSPYDRSGIYLLEEGEAPELLWGAGESGEYSYQPAWQADGEALYLVGVGGRFASMGQTPLLAKVDLETDAIEVVAEAASEPATSHQGEKVAWVSASSSRSLWVLDEPGAEPRQLVAPGTFYDIGMPVFSRDALWIEFLVSDDPEAASTACSSCRQSPAKTAPDPADESTAKAAPDPIGESTAKAAPAHADHSQPGTWWRVPVAGGGPEPITTEGLISYGVDLEPGGQWLAAATGEGLSVIDPTGAKASQAILSSRSLRAVAWVSW